MAFVMSFFSLPGYSRDLGFRFKDGKCLNEKSEEGLNPSFFGQCSDLRNVTISGLDLAGIDFSGSIFSGSDLQLTSFRGSTLVSVSFAQTQVMGANFLDAKIDHADFTGANIQNAKFGGTAIAHSNFSGVDFTNQIMTYAEFVGCTFDRANFSGSQFDEVTFSEASLVNANLDGTNLKGASLVGANLAGASLKGADLRNANLNSANLSDTSLSSSNLEGANVAEANFEKAKYSKNTKLPFSREEADRKKMVFIRLFEFTGFKQNLPEVELDGWKVCHTSLFGEYDVSLDPILSACKAEKVMLACRPVGSKVFTVAAYGSYDNVFKEIGESNEGTVENGVRFYYSNNYSIGFIQPDKTLERFSCDVGDDRGEKQGEAPESRLCFHTSENTLQGGFRCGAVTDLNDSMDYERVFLKSED